MGMVCREREPMLSDEELHEAADSLGFYRSGTFSCRLDVPRSIDATLQQGGCPAPRFESRRQLLSLVLLLDRRARDLHWNTVPQELAAGLRRRGVSVSTWWFYGIPDHFTDSRGRVMEIEDLEEIRRQLIVMLVTDGHGMYRRIDRRPLERMSRWPRVALLDPRPPGLWDVLPGLAHQYRLAHYACDSQGVIQCLRRFTSESGTAADSISGLDRIGRQNRIVRGNYQDEQSFLREFLQQPQLEFAQACALVPAISLGLADRLRRTLFPGLSPSVTGELLAVPGIRLTWAGISFDAPVRDALLHGLQRQDIARQREVEKFVTHHVEAAAGALGEGVQGLGTLQAQFLVGLVRSLVSDQQVDATQMAEIWRRDELSASTDLQVGAVLEHIKSAPFRCAAESRLRRTEKETRGAPKVVTPEHLARIPAGEFWMGDPSEQGDGDERPRHQVYISECFLEKEPVTWTLWQQVCSWAVKHDYQFGDEAAGKAENHPVHSVSWRDAVKWCNARSEMEGLEVCYYEDDGHQRVNRQGEADLQSSWVDWQADGYRLPTEAEWEKAARGGLEDQHYPWESPAEGAYADVISDKRANYLEGKTGGTSAVGQYAANGFGLHDMSGNVDEWCWDFWDEHWYAKPDAESADTRGPLEGDQHQQRVYRGGSGAFGARYLRCSYRLWVPPWLRYDFLGFRVARGRLVTASRERVADAEARDEPPAEATSERSSPSRARLLFVPRSAEENGEVTLTAATSATESYTIKFGKAVELPAGIWQAAFTASGFEPTTAGIEARAYHQRTYCVALRPLVPENLALVPAGDFWMGDPSEQGYSRERPGHRVYVSEFYLEKEPVTWSFWQRVYSWAVDHNYQLGDEAAGKAENHPVHSVSWRDAVKWCNARSEMEGLEVCYYEDDGHQRVNRQGEADLQSSWVDWQADGYRLPTEAEWEKAARGGLEDQHYPWESPAEGAYADVISDKRANYLEGKTGGTSAVGQYAANGFGLHDMSGNVDEWCWDFWDEHWYAKPDAESADTRGPLEGDQHQQRVYRGGSGAFGARYLRCSYRLWVPPWLRYDFLGFRVARGRLVTASRERVADAEARDESPAEATSERGSRGVVGKISQWIRRR